jgi:hypothetical protein
MPPKKITAPGAAL